MRFKNVLMAIAAVASLAAGAVNATELITNGNFDGAKYGQIGWNGNTLAGWTTTGYNFLFNASNDDKGGTNGSAGIVSLWEPVDGPARGIPYVVFAGNVGGPESLADVVDKLSA